ncbi:MAG: M81 family metallopeptidase [Candidatus Latescibacterota bacterium]|jgi:microcystin degradation protein MlrC
MPKILVAECKQEVSSFNPVESDYDYFTINYGAELLAYHNGKETEVRGALDAFAAESTMEAVPIYGARANSAGPLQQESFERIVAEFTHALESHADSADALYFCLHGAMACTEEMDPEGFLLEKARSILGPAVPIVLSLDLHGILTERMLNNSNGLALYHTYPHVDFADTGSRAARLLIRVLQGAKPVVARVKVPALVRGDELITATGIYGESIRRAQALEAQPRVLAAGMMIGNPFTDVPELCSQAVVVTDDDEELAEREALEIADKFWQNRAKMQPHLVEMEEAVEEAKNTAGSVIFTDAADATSSGASGDSNALIEVLIAGDYAGEVLAPIVDPTAAYMAHAAGEGQKLQVVIGGALDARFPPLELQVTVERLSDGDYSLESSGTPEHAGPSAVLRCANYTIVVVSRSVRFYDRSLFLAHELDPQDFDLIVVKSPHCQPQFFDDWAEKNINVDAPGATSANLITLGHRVCQRPIYPLDNEISFTPKAEVYR